MTWVKFSERHPPEGEYETGNYLITRFPPRLGKGNFFEEWRIWKKDYLKASNIYGDGYISHWWDGIYDIDEAMRMWYEENNQEEKEDNDSSE